jgi:hypothetical protein
MSWIITGEQVNPAGDAQITYGITSTGGVFNLRSTGTVDYEVEWGDGTVERSTSNTLAHTYAAGSYVLKIRTAQQYVPYFNNSTDEDQITSVALVSDLDVGTNLTSAWFGANNITSFDAAFGVTAGVTNFRQAWRDCSGLTNFPLIDTSSGTDLSLVWYNCSGLTSFPLIDTSSGDSFQSAWYGCSGLTSFPLIDTSRGTNFQSSWYGCSGLTSFPSINTSSGDNFDNAWRDCTSLTTFPSINTSSGDNFTRAWRNCQSLTSFPTLDTSSGTNFSESWRSCFSLTDFPANFFDSWSATPGINCFFNAWQGCTSLTATSVENILNSIDTSLQSAPASGVDITVDYNAASGTPDISTAVSNLISRGWTITLNGVLQ